MASKLQVKVVQKFDPTNNIHEHISAHLQALCRIVVFISNRYGVKKNQTKSSCVASKGSWFKVYQEA